MRKKILVSPLDWGLGHATRLTPIIHHLIALDVEVVIGAYGKSKHFLELEFPNLEVIELKGIEVTYPKANHSMILKMLKLAKRFYSSIKDEHFDTKILVEKHGIDGIISDNRYGVWHADIPSVLITHQLFVKAPLGEKYIHKIIRNFMDEFDHIWVPDVADEQNLSGDLSHRFNSKKKVKFIGPLSRFSSNEQTGDPLEIMAIVSGPEPQRQLFCDKLEEQLLELNAKALLVTGQPDKNERESKGQLTIVSHLPTTEMEQSIRSAEVVVSRSGYSTIMDLSKTGSRAILVPTPGQTEQEYLAKHLKAQQSFFTVSQNDFDLSAALQEKNYNGLRAIPDSFQSHVASFVNALK